MKLIEFEIPDSVYATLSEVAHKRGTTVTLVLAGAANQLALEWARPLAQQVAELHAQRKTKGEIGALLGMTNQAVAVQLAKLRLPSNPKPPKTQTPRNNPRSRKA